MRRQIKAAHCNLVSGPVAEENDGGTGVSSARLFSEREVVLGLAFFLELVPPSIGRRRDPFDTEIEIIGVGALAHGLFIADVAGTIQSHDGLVKAPHLHHRYRHDRQYGVIDLHDR